MKGGTRWPGSARQAFTFIELLVVLSVLGVGVYFATVGTSGQNAYYDLRGDVERIVGTIQRACIQSNARPNIYLTLPARPVTAGVTFYTQQMSNRFTVQNGLSMVGWWDDLPSNPDAALEPPATLGAANVKIQTLSRSLRSGNVLYRSFPVNSLLADNARLRYRAGRLDVFDATGVVTGGDLTQLNSNFNVVNSPFGPPVAWTFDIANPVVGWVRIRCLSGGFVEVSGINPLNATTPTNVVGGVF